MSFQVLHILTHGAVLRKERGQFVMRTDDTAEKRCALEDLRAVVIAARGVSFSSDLVSALCVGGTVLLHCDERYRPSGITAPLSGTTRTAVLKNQCRLNSPLHRALWRRIVADKVANQEAALKMAGVDFIAPRKSGEKFPDEAAAARAYWHLFFQRLGLVGEVRDQESGTPVNNMLNYGYAVLLSLVHRSIVLHGLLPQIGFHHTPHFAGDPLVYDLMEPFRPFVDELLIGFIERSGEAPSESLFPQWCRTVAQSLLVVTVALPERRQRLLYAVDTYVAAIAQCLEENSAESYWSPLLEKQSFQNGLDHDDVRSAGNDAGGTEGRDALS